VKGGCDDEQMKKEGGLGMEAEEVGRERRVIITSTYNTSFGEGRREEAFTR
jgi:hypothetical protein